MADEKSDEEDSEWQFVQSAQIVPTVPLKPITLFISTDTYDND
jgi:hypothetical protein